MISLNHDGAMDLCGQIILTILKSPKKLLSEESKFLDPGLYLIYDTNGKNLLYIGESGNLQKRHKDLFRTQNHTFRRSFGNELFKDKTIVGNYVRNSREKFSPELETILTAEMNSLLFIEYPVFFGRKELEEYLIDQAKLGNIKCSKLYNIKERRKS